MSKNSFVFVISSFIELNELHFLIEFLIKKNKNLELIVLQRSGKQQEKTKLSKYKIFNFFSKKIKIKFYQNYEDIFQKINKNHLIVISTHPFNHMFGNKIKKCFFVLFQSVFDTFNIGTLDGLKKSDLIFLHTVKWMNYLKKLYGKKIESLNKIIFYYGYKKLFNEKNKAEFIKDKYKLNKNKKVILLLHGNLNRMSSIFNHVYASQNILEMILKFIFNTIKFKTFCIDSLNIIIKNQNYKKFIDALEDFKLKNNCYLITKYRSKYIPPSYVRNISDKVIDDKILFPQVSITLAKISDLMIHFHSTGILEAVYFKVPTICVYKPSNLTIEKNSNTYKTHKITRPKQKLSIFNFKSINPKFDVSSVVDILKNYNSKNLFKINKKHFSQYKKYFIEDHKKLSSERIYNLIKKNYSKKYG